MKQATLNTVEPTNLVTQTSREGVAKTDLGMKSPSDNEQSESGKNGSLSWANWICIASAIVVVCIAYWATLVHISQSWFNDAEYSHGFAVPIFAFFLLWVKRDQLQGGTLKGSWWGLLLVFAGIALRFFATYEFYSYIESLALLPTLAGLAVLGGGWAMLRWALPSIAFLIFMIPLPGFVSDALAQPLQHVATSSSTYLLQLAGIPATAEGHVIVLTDGKIGVAEACSGLRMLMLFVAVATAVALLVKRPTWERALLIASSVPIALAVNILRITATGIAHEMVGKELADLVFHKWGGLLMGPMALGILCLEILFIDRAFMEVHAGPLSLGSERKG